jgi:hypothetical protein
LALRILVEWEQQLRGVGFAQIRLASRLFNTAAALSGRTYKAHESELHSLKAGLRADGGR